MAPVIRPVVVAVVSVAIAMETSPPAAVTVVAVAMPVIMPVAPEASSAATRVGICWRRQRWQQTAGNQGGGAKHDDPARLIGLLALAVTRCSGLSNETSKERNKWLQHNDYSRFVDHPSHRIVEEQWGYSGAHLITNYRGSSDEALSWPVDDRPDRRWATAGRRIEGLRAIGQDSQNIHVGFQVDIISRL